MEVTWRLILTFLALGITCAAENDCSVSHVSPCYNSLVHYEGLGFPLYGEDEVELEETCGTINDSFECINSFVRFCYGVAECDEECMEMIRDIGVFSLNTGLKDLQEELCNPHSAMRETYLENFVCLEDNADKYAKCHNDSQMSQEFMSSIRDPKESLNARCCYFSWYQDCFTNITRDTCGVNATFFVSFSLHKLMGNNAQHMCKDNPVICERPPLPADYALDKDKPGHIGNDIDNSLNDFSTANSSYPILSMYCIIISLFCVVLSKYVFTIK